jgi:hypothetical protein
MQSLRELLMSLFIHHSVAWADVVTKMNAIANPFVNFRFPRMFNLLSFVGRPSMRAT